MLSMLWAKSSGNAFQAGDRMILYAAIATLPFAFPALAAVARRRGLVDLDRDRRDRRVRADPAADRRLAAVSRGPPERPGQLPQRHRAAVRAPVLAADRRRRDPDATAAGCARRRSRSATLCLGLAFLTQSRGIVLGLAVGGVRRARARPRPGAPGVGGRRCRSPASPRPSPVLLQAVPRVRRRQARHRRTTSRSPPRRSRS